MRPVVFTQIARRELIDAQDWYEEKRAGLGKRFRTEVDQTIKRIASGPLRFPLLTDVVRHALLDHFPYDLIFRPEADGSITIIAGFHSSRDPIRWQSHM